MKTPLLNNSSVFNNETPMNKIKNTIDEAMEASFLAALQQSELPDVDGQPEPTTTCSVNHVLISTIVFYSFTRKHGVNILL